MITLTRTVVIFLGKITIFLKAPLTPTVQTLNYTGMKTTMCKPAYNLGDLDDDGKDELGFIFFRKVLIFWGNTLAVGGTFEVDNADLIITRDSTSTSASEKITQYSKYGRSQCGRYG